MIQKNESIKHLGWCLLSIKNFNSSDMLISDNASEIYFGIKGV